MPKKNGPPPAADDHHWCFAWVPPIKGRTKAAVLNEARWPANSIITIGFLDGKKSVQDRVADAARTWVTGLANLQFVFKKDASTCAIRISFTHKGSWSMIGTQCLGVAKSKPTMNYGWLTPTSKDVAVKSVVLHEFGHALGLIHEHQSPMAPIQWNKPKVYADLSGPPNNWDKATIDNNMFKTFPTQALTATQLDPLSIMMYPFPATWTVDGFSTGFNRALSPRDKALIRAVYP